MYIVLTASLNLFLKSIPLFFMHNIHLRVYQIHTLHTSAVPVFLVVLKKADVITVGEAGVSDRKT